MFLVLILLLFSLVQGVVAKKPYNPILGEIFQCYWDLSDISSLDSPCSQLVDSGPVPWAASNSVTFIAEQVSHHPPSESYLNINLVA